MSKQSIPEGPSTRAFLLATVLYLVVVLIGAKVAGFFRQDWTPIDPNEWGDVLAGVFSPLAFLWLLYASLSQRAQLEIQQQEISHAVRAQKKAEDRARQEKQLWVTWYLGCLSDFHDQLINYTAHIVRDVAPLAPLPSSEDGVFQISQLPALLSVETGLPKLHYLPVKVQQRSIKLLSTLSTVHRATLDYRYRAKATGSIEAEHLASYCQMLNSLASESWHVSAEGRTAMASEVVIASAPQ